MNNPYICLILLFIATGLASPIHAAENRNKSATAELLNDAQTILGKKVATRASEKRLEQIVLAMANQTETPATRKLIEELSTRIPTVLIPHDEGGALIPYVDVGAAARVTLRTWEQNAAYEHTLRMISHGDPVFLKTYFEASAAQQTGMINAILGTIPENLVLYRDDVLTQLENPGGDKLAAAIASKLDDTNLYRLVIVDGSAPVALESIRQLHNSFDAETNLSLMQLGLGRSDIASATLFEIGKLTTTLPSADVVLWELLNDPQLGGSVAAVLARHANNTTINRLIDLLQEKPSPLVQQRIVLALKLSGDPTAKQVADDWLVGR